MAYEVKEVDYTMAIENIGVILALAFSVQMSKCNDSKLDNCTISQIKGIYSTFIRQVNA